MKHLSRQVARLKKQIDKTEKKKQSWNYHDNVEVNYFALMDLIEFYLETKTQINKMIIARDLLENVHWVRDPMDKGKVISDSGTSSTRV